MVAETKRTNGPDWDRLYQAAASQEGLFSIKQAAEAGYYPQLLAKHLGKRITHVRRGVYRLIHFPDGEHEDLVAVWLWTSRAGIFSHETALALHGLSDVLPSRTHLTLPLSWRKRRLRVPLGVHLYFGDIDDADRSWVGAIPVTGIRRTIRDCQTAHVSEETIEAAIRDALARGLIQAVDGVSLSVRSRDESTPV